MTFPTHADADPDPTTQIPWPSKKVHIQQDESEEGSTTVYDDANGAAQEEPSNTQRGIGVPKKHRLSTWDLFTLSISMAGAQTAWTVELG